MKKVQIEMALEILPVKSLLKSGIFDTFICLWTNDIMYICNFVSSGTMIAIVQELITTEYIEQSFGPERVKFFKSNLTYSLYAIYSRTS